MSFLRPKYITFDCYGTLTNFQMGPLTRELFADRVPAEQMDQFVQDFAAYRLDQVMGDWRPYDEILKTALARVCKRWGVEYRGEGQLYYDAVPTWGPHADVTAGLAKIADKIPLVIISNAMDEQIMSNVDKLGVPFHKVYTAQQAQAYKPRLQAFEYLLDSLGCGPEDLLHVSSSFRYDLMSAHDMKIKNKAFVARGHEQPGNACYGYHQISDIGGLPALVGL
ncbi:haloacid dehalogenase type II [Pseudomonas benzenivorans]|uniref:Haloacid dehalogenase type II n=1 Tax=Pseudomonas benzenivorans TaxID=556533 RepID=A0ABZ0PZK9_9PSED|nr:haloacid dehalogenase type II [Pseudomonas benzenivorans]WPC06161.1 haloacid dehalogenase type II [Pseudomonas benzenivorans]